MAKRRRPKTPDSAAARLHRLHLDLFRKLKADAEWLLGAPPASIARYERDARRAIEPALKRRVRHATRAQLISAVRAADVAFVGDYHTFAQAQRTALRIAREAARRGERWLLGLEMFPSSAQKDLDRFLDGHLSERAFLKRIRYAESWGFPWENYRPLLEWARRSKARVIALNRPEEAFFQGKEARDMRELRQRDEWAAGIIADTFALSAKGRTRMIVVYGELHVARDHLPERLKRISKAFLGKSLRSVTIHQNQDALYWKALAELGAEGTDVLRLAKDAFCVFSGTPWTQLQSLIHWAEEAVELDADEDEEVQVGFTDPLHCLSQMRFYADAVARFLGVASYGIDDLKVVHSRDSLDLSDTEGLNREERAIIHWHLRAGRRIYVPRAGAAYVGSISQNGLLELAALHLLHSRHRSAGLFSREPGDTARVVAFAAFGFFASLLLNPKRKCAGARELSQPSSGLPADVKSAHRLAARMLSRKKALAIPQSTTPEVAFVACTLAGRAQGRKLFDGMLKGKVSIAEIRAAFFSRASTRDWGTALRGLFG